MCICNNDFFSSQQIVNFYYTLSIEAHRMDFGLNFQEAYGNIMEFGAFAMRFDYSYFFKDGN